MKIHGEKISCPNFEIIPIVRPGREDIIFKATAVTNWDEFNVKCPEPKPPMMQKPGGQAMPDLKDKAYKIAVEQHNKLWTSWMVIMSLRESPGLEWEKVKLDDQNTWNLYSEELSESGFNNIEIRSIMEGCLAANSLSEKKVEEARKRFLAGQGQESSV